MSKKEPFATQTKETSEELLMDKGKIVPDQKNMPRGAFNPNKGSK